MIGVTLRSGTHAAMPESMTTAPDQANTIFALLPAHTPELVPLTKATAHDVWVCALKASLSLEKRGNGPAGWVQVVAEDDATWTVEIVARNEFVTADRLAASVETFRGYLWGYGREPVANGNRITLVKNVDPKNVKSG